MNTNSLIGAPAETGQSGPPLIEVRSCKFDGSVHRRWPAALTARRGVLIVLEGVFLEEVRHNLLGVIERGTVSTEYYWTDRCYNVFRFVTPTGALRNYYCNINLPPTLHDEVLSYIDLDIDVLVAPDFSYQVLDEDEFAANAARFGYPVETRETARRALAELIALIEERRFPFAAE